MQDPTTSQEQTGTRPPPGTSGHTAPWHALPPESVLSRVESTAAGLTHEQARERLARHGPNVLKRERGDGVLTLLWRQVNSPLIWVLIASAVLAVLLGKVTDGLVVAAVVVLNTLV